MTTTYIINTTKDFGKYFKLLKEDAARGDKQRIYVVGLDTEFICRDNYQDSYERSSEWVIDNESLNFVICTVQIASENVCLVINLTKMGLPLPKKLVKLFTSESWLKMGIGIDGDMRILSSNYQLGHCSGVVELKSFPVLASHPKPNLEFLYNQFVGGHAKKTDSVHDWALELTDEQIRYAARDAIMSYQLGMAIFEPTVRRIDEVVKNETSSKLSINIIGVDDQDSIMESQEVRKSGILTENYVGTLQEYSQQNRITLPVYEVVNIDESVHPKVFTTSCKFDGSETFGSGKSKREAKADSAKEMLSLFINK